MLVGTSAVELIFWKDGLDIANEIINSSKNLVQKSRGFSDSKPNGDSSVSHNNHLKDRGRKLTEAEKVKGSISPRKSSNHRREKDSGTISCSAGTHDSSSNNERYRPSSSSLSPISTSSCESPWRSRHSGVSSPRLSHHRTLRCSSGKSRRRSRSRREDRDHSTRRGSHSRSPLAEGHKQYKTYNDDGSHSSRRHRSPRHSSALPRKSHGDRSKYSHDRYTSK